MDLVILYLNSDRRVYYFYCVYIMDELINILGDNNLSLCFNN